MTGAKLEILFRDEHLVAVNKPAGLLVHRSPVDRHETLFALQLVRDQLGRHVYPVHRLDRGTSGVLLFALSPDMASLLGTAFMGGAMSKEYLAVVRGRLDDEGVIDHPLVEVSDRFLSSSEGGGAERDAVTRYRRLGMVELPFAVGRYATSRYSLAAVSPVTGRRHQLRRHFKHIFHPLIGDTRYGEGRHNRFFREEFGCSRLLLHARQLTFRHPVSGERVIVTATLDESFVALLVRLGWFDAVVSPPLPEG